VRTVLVAVLSALALALALAAPAGADPDDHVPYCSGDQTPMDSNCRVTSSQVVTHECSGLSPNLPYGLDPGNEPAV
jgi:hypothetical protein